MQTLVGLLYRHGFILVHLLSQLQFLLLAQGRPWPSTLFPPRTRSCEARVGPFPDQIPLKLCQRPEDVKDQFAA